MTEFIRLLRLFVPHLLWLVAGGVLALLALASNLLLLASAGAGLVAAGGALALLRLAGAARPLLRYTERLTTHGATLRALSEVRLWLFARLVPLAPARLGNWRGGDMLTRLLSDVQALDGLYLRLLLPLCIAGIALSLALSGLASLNPGQAGIVIAELAPAILLLTFLSRRAAPSLEALADLQGDLRAHLQDSCDGLTELLTSQATHQQLSRIAHANAALNRSQLAGARLRARTTFITLTASALIVASLLLLWPSSPTTIPVAPTGILMALALLELLPPATGAFQHWPLLRAAAKRIFQLADQTPACPEPATPRQILSDLTLRAEHLAFTYPGRPPLLQPASWSVGPDERIHLSGPSGAGKSTLLHILMKFLLPTQGRLTVGGVPLGELEGDAWRRQIGALSQQTSLLAGTLRENLALADPTASEQKMYTALRDAGLDEFTRALPDGLDSWIGESGTSLSGGQARRVALAQLLLKEAPIWLLDEPTEGLDAMTARSLIATLNERATGKMVWLVSHDPECAAGLQCQRTLRLTNGHFS